MSRAALIHQVGSNDDELEVDEREEPANDTIYNKVYGATEKFAGTYVGQYAMGKIDRLLKLIEDTAKWSLPQQNQDKNDAHTPLERPLPWIPFIAMILVLRMTRLSLSIAGLLIGNEPLAAKDVVYFIQTRRRKLRAIRIVGMRNIHRKEQDQHKSSGFLTKLRSLLAVIACQPGQGREIYSSETVHQNSVVAGRSTDAYQTTSEINKQSFKRQRTEDEDDSEQELTLDQLIDKYSEVNSDNDSDFIPPSDALNVHDLSSQSTSSATSDENDNNNKVKQLKENAELEADGRMTNGKKRSTNTSTINDNQAIDNTIIIKENGDHFTQSSVSPISLPKPHKQKCLPVPIQDIKQEPFDNADDPHSREELKRGPMVFKSSTEQSQQAVFAQNDENLDVYDCPNNKDVAVNKLDKAVVKENGLEILPENDETSGSPNLSGNFGFHPTTILKNLNADYIDKRGPAVVYPDEDTSRADTISMPINTSYQPPKGNNQSTGKHNKNSKLRGKRR